MRKFTETNKIEGYEILTDTGWEDIENLHTTVEYEIYEVHLENDTMLRCADDHILFRNDLTEIFVKDLKPGDMIKCESGNCIISGITKTGIFETMYDIELKNSLNKRYYINGILSHNTQLAKELASIMFGDPDALIRVDMSEYMEKFEATKLIGAPPGYVGHEDGGQLTEKVRRKPYSIVLFDEIEKAHPDIFNTMLQILDEGAITDGMGRKINFKNTLIILTSNVGQRNLQDYSGGMGFTTKSKQDKAETENEILLKKELQKTFSPEFINRLDDIVYFKALEKDDIIHILDVEINKIMPRLEGLGYKVKVAQDLKEKIAENGFDPKFGARPIKRMLQKYVEDTLADLMVQGKIEEGSTVTLSYDPVKEADMQIPVKVKINTKKKPNQDDSNKH